ncbi:MAG: UvrD-helicase domain-containing protein, partial [Bacteroidales bacterium]|nr:UvrD-helicase domain-containing protein [Bacteroidales bacterium]
MGKLDNVKFISASAGSGKTYSLTQNMVQFIEQGLNPESFILTTFTKAAAAEFKEKSKAALFKKAQEVDSEKKHIFLDAAARIDNATIGTIHSVAHQFISQYWYLLGISPEIKVITDEDKAFYMNQSLMGCVAKDDLNFFNSLTWNFEIRKYLSSEYDFEFWKNDVEKLIAATVSFNIQELDKYCNTSKKLLKPICGIYHDTFYVLPSEEVIINSVKKILDCVAFAPRIKREEKKEKIISILDEFKESKDNALFRYKILTTKLGKERTDGLYKLSSESFDLSE